MEFYIHLLIHLWAKREGSRWRTVPCSTNLQHHQHQHLDREKSPKHCNLSPVPALCLHPYTQNTTQISWFYLQGKCGRRTPGKPGAGRKDAPSQGSQQWEMYNQCCIISLNCAVWHKASICGCPTGVPMATAATAVLGPTATSEWWLTKGTVETLCCIPPQLLANSGKGHRNWNKAGKSVIFQKHQLAKISSFCPWMNDPLMLCSGICSALTHRQKNATEWITSSIFRSI